MSEKNISPKIAPSIYSILEQMKNMGLTEEDIICLIQKRTKNRVNKTEIKITVNALKNIEQNFERAKKRRETKVI